MDQGLEATILRSVSQVVEIARGSLDRGVPMSAIIDSRTAIAAEPTTCIEPAPRKERYGAGRTALRRAASVVGVELGEIDRAARGAAALPVGLIGSISHIYGCSIAIVARASAVMGLGIDLERNSPARLRIAQRVLTDAERCRIADLAEPERWRAVLALFCAKEATFKALDGLVDARLTFKRLEIVQGLGATLSVRILVVAQGVGVNVAVVQDKDLTAAVAVASRL